MRGSSHEPCGLDTGGAAQPLAAPSDAACHAPDRLDLGHRAVERRASPEPAGARILRPCGGDLWRLAHADAGCAQRRDFLANPLRETAPRRLAGLASA